MRIVVTGSHGLIGSALVTELEAAGHEAIRLVRGPAARGGKAFSWEPTSDRMDASVLEEADAVVHLAGKSLAAGRWSGARKEEIRISRVAGTQLLSQTLARLKRPPRVFLSASAIGYYGSRGDVVLTEETAAGSGFLAEVCREWEAAMEPAAQSGIRVVPLRFAMVLSGKGGALGKMLPLFRKGLGGVLGNGRQVWSWIALPDVIAAVLHLLATDTLAGPFNLAAPHPVTNREFTRVLGEILGRRAFAPVPALALRLAVGEMADELLLSSARVLPSKLLASGFAFRFPKLPEALAQACRIA